ncbi:MAG TPA: antitoxin [Stellaceae bacterium]|nr:antitoxin [Stellaceae bacterium]
MTALSPIESEFATTEEAEAYDRWFRAKVQASLDDPRPAIPHDQAMAEIDAIIAQAEQRSRRPG